MENTVAQPKPREALKATPSLPHNLEMEMAVIGGLLSDTNAIFEIGDRFRPDFFHIDIHRMIAESIIELSSDGISPDLPAVAERLSRKNPDFNLSEYQSLHDFFAYAVNPANLPHWLDTLRRYWELRQVITTCGEISIRGRQVVEADVEEFLQEVEGTFLKLSESRVTKGLRPAADIVGDAVMKLESLIENPASTTGIPSGFVDLDKVTSGWQRSDLIVFGARPAMGKTAFALNLAANAAINSEHYCAFFSLEMSAEQLIQRMLAMNARIQAHRFRDGQMDVRDFEKLYNAVREFQTDRLMIDDTPGLSLMDVASRCRKMKREKKHCDLIIIDYLQLMNAGPGMSGGKVSREQEISYISRGLKGLAKELNCPIIALAQLNRDLEKRPDKRPKPADLRESGAIEQDADQIMFLYRDEVYHKDSQDKGMAEVIIGKNRHGPTCTIRLAFHAEYTSFHNLAPT